MFKLTRLHEELIVESETEEQARNILERTMNEFGEYFEMNDTAKRDRVDVLVKRLKSNEPTDQKKYLHFMALLLREDLRGKIPNSQGTDPLKVAGAFFGDIKSVFERVQKIEEQTGSKLQYSKDNGLFFNKDIEAANISAGESVSKSGDRSVDPVTFKMNIGNIYEQIETYKKLRDAEKTKRDVDVDVDENGERKVLVDKDSIKVEVILSHRVCIESMEEGGADFCVKNMGRYHKERAMSTFYGVHDRTQEKATAFVLVQVFSDGKVKVHDRRNDGGDSDTPVLMDDGSVYDHEDYFKYLEREHNIKPKELFEHVELNVEDQLGDIANRSFSDIVGHYIRDDDTGEIYDAVKIWIAYENNKLRPSEWEDIKKHGATNALRDEYFKLAIDTQSLSPMLLDEKDPVIVKGINKFVDRLIKKPGILSGTIYETEYFITQVFRSIKDDKIDDFVRVVLNDNYNGSLIMLISHLTDFMNEGKYTKERVVDIISMLSDDLKEKTMVDYGSRMEILPPHIFVENVDDDLIRAFAERFLEEVDLHSEDVEGALKSAMKMSRSDLHPKLKKAIEEKLGREIDMDDIDEE